MSAILEKVVTRIHERERFLFLRGIRYIDHGSFRDVYGYKDLIIKKDRSRSEFTPSMQNQQELKNYQRIVLNLNKKYSHYFLPILFHTVRDGQMYLVFPRVTIVEDYVSRGNVLSKFQRSMLTDANNLFSDNQWSNVGIVKKTLMVTDYTGELVLEEMIFRLRGHGIFYSINKCETYKKFPYTFEKYHKEAVEHFNQLRKKYQLSPVS